MQCGVFAVAALEQNLELADEMLKSVRNLNSSVLLHLLTIVKTHKPQGKVEHRNAHAGTRWAFTRLAQWVTRQLMDCLQYDHIATGLQDFVRKRPQSFKWSKDPSCTV